MFKKGYINGTLGTGILNLWISYNDIATADKQFSTKCDTSNLPLVVHGPTAHHAYHVWNTGSAGLNIAVDGTMLAYQELNIGGIGNGAKQIDTTSSSDWSSTSYTKATSDTI